MSDRTDNIAAAPFTDTLTEQPHPTCGTCPYWGGSEKGVDLEFAEVCRRHARPSSVSWTRVYIGDWCGDHPDFPAWIESRKK
ncbi:MAG: hypothetical protein GY832_23585 [Chloroflexi bacterium]|nr:hypothetical protein [Chloroflexota bacterium]